MTPSRTPGSSCASALRCALSLLMLLAATRDVAAQSSAQRGAAADAVERRSLRAARSAPPAGAPSLFGELHLLPAAFLHSFSSPGAWDGAAWNALPSWLGGLAGLSLLDEWTRDLADRPVPHAAHAALDFVEPFGAEASFAVLGGFYAAGLALGDRRARSVALEGLAASALAGGVITPTLQRVTGRKRPRHSAETHDFEPFSGHVGFPSGHVTQAFAVASVIATEYPDWWVDGVAYGMATGVALHRILNDAHHLSDVAGGALIGTLVGRCVATFGQEWRSMGAIRPMTGSGLADGTSVGLSVTF